MSEPVKHSVREIVLLVFVAVALYLVVSLYSFHLQDSGWTHTAMGQSVHNFGGIVGAWLADFLLSFLGISAYLLPCMLGYHGWVLYRHDEPLRPWRLSVKWLGLWLTTLVCATLMYLHFWNAGSELPNSVGGILGMELGKYLARSFGMIGSSILLLTALLASVTVLTGTYWLGLIDRVGQRCYAAWIIVKTSMTGFRLARNEQHVAEEIDDPQLYVSENDILNQLSIQSDPDEPVISHTEVEQVEQKRFSDSLKVLIKDANDVGAYRDEVLDFDDEGDALWPGKSSAEPSLTESSVAAHPTPDLLPVTAPVQAPDYSEEIDGLAALTAQGMPITAEPEWASNVAAEDEPEATTQHHAVMRPAHRSAEPEQSARKKIPAGSLPPLDALDQHRQRVQGYSKHQLESMADKVEQILGEFGVKATVKEVHPGPVITRFEMDLAPGTKASKVTNLSRDLARALTVQSVRVVEVIPGKSLIGLEIPNNEREMVTLRQVLAADEYQQASSKLTMALGQSISGQPVVADLAKMPHLLVAGTTGSGKSVAVNAMILSLLYKATPEEVRMIMVDPKMLELSVYEDIPHLLTPVVTDMKLASQALRWCVAEMERRYQLMSMMGVRNLEGFNQKISDAIAAGQPIKDPLFQPIEGLSEPADAPDLTTLPQIVIVIDELADMMMIVGKKVEELIARLAQKARAAGLHLILATQRPSVDVLTGLIKANVPTRIGFQVSSKIDSRTILDQSGAEALLGNGDMLYLPPGTSLPQRAHGAFVSDQEVHRVVEFLKRTGGPQYIKSILEPEVGEGGYEGGAADSEADALYDQAVYFVTQSRKASISSVQRKFKIGYNRAATIIESMENSGVVSSPETNGSRQVLAPPPV